MGMLDMKEKHVPILLKSPFKLLYIFRSIGQKGGQQIDGYKLGHESVKVSFRKKLYAQENILSNNITEEAGPSEALLELALLAGHKSRYREDSNISEERFKALYTTWLLNSFKGSLGDVVLSYKQNGALLGFISIKKEGHTARVGLVAVKEQFQLKNIGKSLVAAAEHWAYQQDCNSIRVCTQEHNLAAISLYKSCGYQEQAKVLVQHFWKG